jgi:signal transduction histidine kinase
VEREAIERATRLLRLATALADATSVETVAEVVIRDGMTTVGADAAAFALLNPASGAPGAPLEFQIVRRVGFPEPMNERFQRWPLRAGRPLSDAVLTRRPVLLSSTAEWRERYPDMAAMTPELEFQAMANIPVVVQGTAIAGITFSFREPRPFDEPSRTFLATVGEQCGIALGRARAFEAERRARDRSAFLAEASRLLATSLEYEATLDAVARATVPRLADWCAVDVIENPAAAAWPPRLQRLAVVHEDPAKVRLAEELERRYPPDWSAPTGIALALRDRTPVFLPAIGDEMLVAGARDAHHLELLRAFRFGAAIIVPLIARERTLGALTLIMSESGRRYDEEDLALATALAGRAAIAVDNARLFREAERARRQAEEANQAKSDFLARMSHELRTPLNAIAGYTELIEIGIHGPVTDAQRDALKRVQRSGNGLRSIIDDVLSFARLESGRMQYRFTNVPLDATLAGLEALVGPQLRARGLEYEHRRADPGITVWADAEKLEQIMLNLLTNALKFTERGTVTVECEARPDEVLVHVRDTGPGIPAEKLEAIFEPFVQAQAALTRTSTGSGLGLPISRDLARAMGGDVTVESTPGVGSTFTVRLPRRSPA